MVFGDMTMTKSRSILFGAALIVAGMAIIGLIDNFVRFIAVDAGLWQFHAARSLIAVPLLLAFCRWQGLGLKVLHPGKVAVRTITQAISVFLYFAAIPMIPIAQVGAALFTAPMFVLLFAVALFRQRIGLWRIFAVLLGFFGVILILQPEQANFSMWSLVPLVAGAFYGLSNLLTREWCVKESPQVLVGLFFATMGLVGLVAASIFDLAPPDAQTLARAPFLLQGWVWTGTSFWFWVSIQAVGSLVAVACLTRGYLSGETSSLAVFEYSYLAFASFWGWMIWDEALALRTVFGISLIVAAGAVIAMRSGIAAQAALLAAENRP